MIANVDYLITIVRGRIMYSYDTAILKKKKITVEERNAAHADEGLIGDSSRRQLTAVNVFLTDLSKQSSKMKESQDDSSASRHEC